MRLMLQFMSFFSHFTCSKWINCCLKMLILPIYYYTNQHRQSAIHYKYTSINYPYIYIYQYITIPITWQVIGSFEKHLSSKINALTCTMSFFVSFYMLKMNELLFADAHPDRSHKQEIGTKHTRYTKWKRQPSWSPIYDRDLGSFH